MFFYQFHPAEYMLDTAHLTLLEHGVYRRLIDIYYGSEKPLEDDTNAIERKLMARTEEEREAVARVLAEFFVLTNGAWSHKRIDADIADYRSNSKKSSYAAYCREQKKKSQPVATFAEWLNLPPEQKEKTPPPPNKEKPVQEYPDLSVVLQWAEMVMVPAECAEKWHATREAENWVTRNGHALNSDHHALRAFFNTYATQWKANEFKSKQQNATSKTSTPRSDTANKPGRYDSKP